MANRSSSRYLWFIACIAYGALVLNLHATPTEVELTATQYNQIISRLTSDSGTGLGNLMQMMTTALYNQNLALFGSYNPTTANMGLRINAAQIKEITDELEDILYAVDNLIANTVFWMDVQYDSMLRQESTMQGMSNHLKWVEHYLIAVEEHLVLDDFPVQIEIRDATRNISVVLTNLYDLIASGISIDGNIGLDDGTGTIESADDPIDNVTMADAVRDEAESDWTIAGTNYMSLPGMIDIKPDDGPLDIAQADLLDKAQEPSALTFAIPTASQLAISFSTFPAEWGFPQEKILDWESIPGVPLMRGALVALIWAGFAVKCIRGFE